MKVDCVMKSSAERISLVIRALLLMICCTLFLPQGLHTGSNKSIEDSAFRVASMTLAITGISNPSAQLQNLANGETAALRNSGQRTGLGSSGQRTSLSSPGKRDRLDWIYVDTDGDFYAALPDVPPAPDSFSLCTKEQFSFCVLPPDSHGHLHWYTLAPPASRNV